MLVYLRSMLLEMVVGNREGLVCYAFEMPHSHYNGCVLSHS